VSVSSTSRPDLASLRRRLQGLDERLAAGALLLRSPGLDGVLVRLTRAASYSRLWLAIATVLAACGGARGRRAAFRGVLAVAIASVLANGPAKLLARRRRPPTAASPPLIGMPRSTSFPSGHSASAAAFATGAGSELPAARPALAGLAAAVAYSRVHAGVHYPSDVAAGIAIGIGSGLLAAHAPLCAPGRAGCGLAR
jgi:undecaprenyl-diphosphatase